MQPVAMEPNWVEVAPAAALTGTLRNFSNYFAVAREDRDTDQFTTLKGPGRAYGAEVRLLLAACPLATHLLCEVWSLDSELDTDALLQSPVLAFPVVSVNASVAYHKFFLPWPLIRAGCRVAVSVPAGATTQNVAISVRRWKLLRGE